MVLRSGTSSLLRRSMTAAGGTLQGLALLLATLLLCSCSTLTNHSFDFDAVPQDAPLTRCDDGYLDNNLANHAILIDHNGKPLGYGEGSYVQSYEYRRHLDRMFDNLAKFYAGNSQKGRPTKVMIFIHGGLNSLKETVKRAHDRTCDIFTPEDPDTSYPIFINWDSGPWSSLSDHLFLVRQGEVRKVAGPATSPLVALEDVAKSIAGAPSSWYYQYISTDLRSLIFPSQPYDHACPERYRCLVGGYVNAVNALYCAEQQQSGSERIAISLDSSAETWTQGTSYGKAFTYLLTAPTTKLVTTPFIAGMGRPAWDIMVRRTTNMFTRPKQFDIRHRIVDADSPEERRTIAAEANAFKRSGALAGLLEQLNGFSANHPDLEVTLIGHSMGTIVISNILRDDSAIDHVPVRNIVYLAAACPVRDVQTAVVPFLQSRKDARFYNLTLHPVNDADEIAWELLDLIPRGSLLEWIDNFYTTPGTHLDRTLGKWNNIVQALNVIPADVRSRVTIKGFGLGDEREFGPQKHGDFDNYSHENGWKFWDEGFWQAGRYYH